MKTTTKTAAFALSSLFFSATALAQQPVPPPPPAVPAPGAPAPAPAAPAAPAMPAAPPADVPPPPPADAPPPAEVPLPERVSEVEQKVDGINESLSTANATLGTMSKLKFSGYIQGRYEKHDESISGVSPTGAITNFDRFFVRRGRLKATYTGDMAEYLLQIDATGDAVVLKDAEATFVEPWTPLGMRLTMGQFKVPFGYEVLQSSADREMPERAAVIRALFPGERDRGIRLTGRYEWFKFMAALVNGNFTQGDGVFSPVSRDNNRYFDTYLRVIGDFDFLVVGLSGEFGEKLLATVTTAISDRNMNGVLEPSEVAPLVSMQRYGVWRFGADAQLYFDIPHLGGLALKGELVMGQETNRDFRGAVANSCLDKKQLGWIATGVQNIGDYVGVVVRIDSYDPNRDVTGAMCATTAVNAAAIDRQIDYGFGLLGFVSANLKASLIYEKITEQGTNVKDNDVFTAQLQARF